MQQQYETGLQISDEQMQQLLTGARVVSAECTHNWICSLHISYSIIVDIPNLLAFLRPTCLQKFEVRKNVVLRVKSGDTIESIARSVP